VPVAPKQTKAERRKDLMRNLLVAISLSFWASISAAEYVEVDWNALIDGSVQTYEDPYLDLTSEQLADLVDVARLRQKIGSGDDSASSELVAREAALTEAGIDADWLISQRWVVAERRERAATAGNSELDGSLVTIAGFAIPAPPEENGTPAVYLVEQRGMCSHMPPPIPNQMIRVRLETDWTPAYMHQPVRLTGKIHIDPSERVFQVVDGDVAMKATWRMDASKVEDFKPAATAAAAGGSDWVEQLRSKLQDSRATMAE